MMKALKVLIFLTVALSGTNLQALIDDTRQPNRHAQIVLVISNKAGVKGLERAQNAGIPTKVTLNFAP